MIQSQYYNPSKLLWGGSNYDSVCQIWQFHINVSFLSFYWKELCYYYIVLWMFWLSNMTDDGKLDFQDKKSLAARQYCPSFCLSHVMFFIPLFLSASLFYFHFTFFISCVHYIKFSFLSSLSIYCTLLSKDQTHMSCLNIDHSTGLVCGVLLKSSSTLASSPN